MNLEITLANEAASFAKIAETLINHYHLQINKVEIEFCDLEFYWNVSSHADTNTHSHFYQNGQLRPHPSGYDIALRNKNGYGGILIRGIMSQGIPTYGPFLSADVIFKLGADLTTNNLTIGLKEKVLWLINK